MAKLIVIPAEKVAEFLTPEEMASGAVVRLYVTKCTRGAKGTHKVRMFEGTPCDDSASQNPEASHKLKFGDIVNYNGEMATVSKVRRTWIELQKEDGSKIWTRLGNTEPIASTEAAPQEQELVEA